MKNNQQAYISPEMNIVISNHEDILTTSGTIITDGLTAHLGGGSSERVTWVG